MPQESMNNSVQIAIQRPCGCVMTHALRSEGELADAERAEVFLKFAIDRLAYWVKCRWDRHDCALVSKDNPSGIKPLPPS